MLPGQFLLLAAKCLLLAPQQFLLPSKLFHRLVHGLDLRQDAWIFQNVGLPTPGEPQEVTMRLATSLLKLLVVAVMPIPRELNMLAVALDQRVRIAIRVVRVGIACVARLAAPVTHAGTMTRRCYQWI